MNKELVATLRLVLTPIKSARQYAAVEQVIKCAEVGQVEKAGQQTLLFAVEAVSSAMVVGDEAHLLAFASAYRKLCRVALGVK